MNIPIQVLDSDLNSDFEAGDHVAIDTETTGLNHHRDRLCVVQIASQNGQIVLVRFREQTPTPNLRALLVNEKIGKIFHFGRFDIATLLNHIGPLAGSVFCTHIASNLTRTYSNSHSLKTLCAEFLGVQLDKTSQCTDWAAKELSDQQLEYAASDVRYLHALREKLLERLEREGRSELANACFTFLPHRAALDLAGWDGKDILAHH